MASNVTRINAPAAAAKARYVCNRVVGALLRDERVLLVNLDPVRDFYSQDVGNLRGTAHYPDCDIVPGDHGALGDNLTYVSWTSSGEFNGKGAGDTEHLLDYLRVTPVSVLRPGTDRKTLVVLDGCEWLDHECHAALAPRIRRFAADCVASGCQLLAVGVTDRDTGWLENLLPGIPARPVFEQLSERVA
jgi:hypothetical protein